MKLYFHVDKQPVNGYNNINLATDAIDLNNLDALCERSECTEIILDEVLSHFNFPQISSFVNQISTRLRLNGKMIVVDMDLSTILDLYKNGMLSLQDLNLSLFGQGRIKKCSICSTIDIINILTENRLKLESSELNKGRFILIAKREKNDG